MKCVILFRIGDGKIDAVREVDCDGVDFVSEFDDAATADRRLSNNALFQSGQGRWQIVRLESL